MLKREELTAEHIDQIVADARKAGYDFFLSAEEREASLKEALTRYQPGEEAWVFAYGSLMWNPALEFAEAQPCKVDGWRRSFCFWVPLGRGTPELPGLMLALERGGECEGIAYRLAPDQVRSELAILWNREMLAGVYQPRWVPTRLRDGRTGHGRHLRGRYRALPVLRRSADRAGGASHRLRRRPPRCLPRLSRQHRCPCARPGHQRSLHRGAGATRRGTARTNTSSRRCCPTPRPSARPSFARRKAAASEGAALQSP